ncbi:hypothetical protein DICVIV_12602, partial [Dictyocaulus viviparus]
TAQIESDATSSKCEPQSRKKYVKRVDRILKEIRSKNATTAEILPSTSTSQPIVQPVILVVPTDNVAATVDAIKEIFRSMNETTVQVQPFEFHSSSEKTTAGDALVRQGVSSCDNFNSSFNPVSFFSPSTATANASSSTDQASLDFTQNTTFCYDEQQPVEEGIRYSYGGDLLPQVRNQTTSTHDRYTLSEIYEGETSAADGSERIVRTFGTMVDEKVFSSLTCVRNAETSMDAPEFDLLRDTETQTLWSDSALMTDVWTDMGQSP